VAGLGKLLSYSYSDNMLSKALQAAAVVLVVVVVVL